MKEPMISGHFLPLKVARMFMSHEQARKKYYK